MWEKDVDVGDEKNAKNGPRRRPCHDVPDKLIAEKLSDRRRVARPVKLATRWPRVLQPHV